jgi:hypothetical protein
MLIYFVTNIDNAVILELTIRNFPTVAKDYNHVNIFLNLILKTNKKRNLRAF